MALQRSLFPGLLYLIHFDQAYFKARHYLGFTEGDVDARVAAHRDGHGSPLMKAIEDAGIPWSVVRTWPGDRNTERRYKRHKNLPRYCPVCNPEHWETGWTNR